MNKMNKMENMNKIEKKTPIFHYNKDLRPFSKSKQKFLKQQVRRLKKIIQPEQRTPEWYINRENKITASDIATAIDKSKYQRDYVLLKKKVTKDRKFITNRAIEWGIKYEEVAIKIYEYRNKTKITEYGCIPHPCFDWIGASPDGINDDGIMLEIKCPSSREITGEVPYGYWCQMQTQLEVCELDRCDFLECKLIEYENRDEYEKDNYEDNYFYNNIGMEKGVIVEFFNTKTSKYEFVYSKLGILDKKIDKFVEKSKDERINETNIIFSSVCYWKLERISCVPVYRNIEWFNSILPKLRKFWDDVLLYRTKTLKELEDYILLKKKLNRKNKKKSKNTKQKFKETKLSDFTNDISGNIMFLGLEDKKEKSKKEEEEHPKFGFSLFKNDKEKIDNLKKKDRDETFSYKKCKNIEKKINLKKNKINHKQNNIPKFGFSIFKNDFEKIQKLNNL